MAAAFRSVLLCILYAVTLLVNAQADDSLQQWRDKTGEIRVLAENDVPSAYREAKRLLETLPSVATSADRSLALNLLSRVEVYLGLSEPSALHAQQALDLATQSGDRIGQAEADLNVALNAVNQGRIDAMIAAVMHSMTVLDGTDRLDLLGEAMLRTSMMYRRMEQFDESVATAMRALEVAKSNNNLLALAYAYQGMAAAYDLSSNYKQAREYYQLMLEQARSAHSRLLEAEAILGIGNTSVNLGELDSGERMTRKAVELFQATSAPFYSARAMLVLADGLRKTGRIDDALNVLKNVIPIYERGRNKIGLWMTISTRSKCYQALDKFDLANTDAEQGYRLAKEIGFSVYLGESARRQAAITAARGNHKLAYQLLVEAAEIDNKAATEKSTSRIAVLARRYENEGKQRQIDQLNLRNERQSLELRQRSLEQRWLRTVLGSSIVMLAGTGFFLFRARRSQRRLKLLNKQVLQAKNKLQATLDTIPDLMFEVGLDGRYYECHSPQAEWLAEPAEMLIGKTVAEVMPIKTAAIYMAALREAHEKGISTSKQVLSSLPQGDLWFELSVACKPVIDGDEPRFIVLSRNITERKHYEAALQARAELEQRQSQFFKIAPGYFYTVVNRPTQRYAMPFASAGLRDLYGLEPEQIADDIRPMLALVHPDDLALLRQKAEVSARNLTPFHVEHRIRHPQKGERWIEASSLPQRQPDGSTLWHGFMLDVTERKQAEAEILALNSRLEQRVIERTEELRQQTRYLRTIIDTLPLLIWLKDTESRFVLVNQSTAASCALAVDEMVGKTDFDFWPRAQAELYIAEDREVMATRQRKIVEEPFSDMRGATWIEIDKVPVLDDDSSVLGTVGVARNIGARKALESARENALAEAVKLAHLRSEFMARMSHELRTPLNGILGYAQVLLKGSRLNERQTNMLKVMQQSGEHLLNLINDILDFAKIEAGKQTLNISEIALPLFLRNLAGIVSVKADLKHLVFVSDIATDIPQQIRADETKLRQVLLNLLSNAIKYSERGHVALRVSVMDSGYLRFEIEDSGIGIDADQQEAIFHPFEQVAGRSNSDGGSGLGLAISRELVRLMGSDILVSSQIGKGSTFWFDLDPSASVPFPVAEIQAADGFESYKRVLVLGNADENQATLLAGLNGLGLEAVTAGYAEQFPVDAKAWIPDLVIVDVAIAEVAASVEAIRHLRGLPGLQQTTIIAILSEQSVDYVDEVTAAGANMLLFEPFETDQLLHRIAQRLKLDTRHVVPEPIPGPPLLPVYDLPPLEEMTILYRSAREGSMRDIVAQVNRLQQLDARYRPFAEQLRSLALGYQSKALLDLVEGYIHQDPTSS